MGENSLEGLALIRRIRARDSRARIVVLSMHDDPTIIACALEAGASGYVIKDGAIEELLNAIKTVQEGNLYFPQRDQRNEKRIGTVRVSSL